MSETLRPYYESHIQYDSHTRPLNFITITESWSDLIHSKLKGPDKKFELSKNSSNPKTKQNIKYVFYLKQYNNYYVGIYYICVYSYKYIIFSYKIYINYILCLFPCWQILLWSLNLEWIIQFYLKRKKIHTAADL